MNLTASQKARTKQALAETHALLSKELSYMPKFQKADYVAELRAHVAKLENMLSV